MIKDAVCSLLAALGGAAVVYIFQALQTARLVNQVRPFAQHIHLALFIPESQ
jgi:hypothetical protein